MGDPVPATDSQDQAVAAPIPAYAAPQSAPTATVRTARTRVEDIVAAAGETTYTWSLEDDQILWQQNAEKLLGVRAISMLASGTAFHLHIGTEHAGARHEAIRSSRTVDTGEGVPYRLKYRFLPQGRRSDSTRWIEDQGRWYAGPKGRPAVARGIIRVIDDRHQEEERLRVLSECDELTGLLNTNRLLSAVSSAVAESHATGQPLAFLLIAINNLATVNETFGFTIGDEVIAQVGQRLQRFLRGGDVIGRFSANKFGLVIHHCDTDGVQAVARRLIRAVRDSTVETSVCRISASISIGAVVVPHHAETPNATIGAALDALEEARVIRQDRLVTFTPNPKRVSLRRRNIEVAENIIAALDEKRMRIALQPVVDAHTRKPLFQECLLRMQMHDGSIVSAGEFIPVAEQLGLARLIDQRVLEMAVDLVRNDPGLSLSFNVSGLTASDHDWLVLLQTLTGGSKALTSRLLVEITETTAIQDIDETVTFVDTLKELGCRVAIDDFGAGYTSFKNLRMLGADMVKIDGAFVKNMLHDKADRVFVETLFKLAESFGMQTVAEWVGDEETAQLLADIGIGGLQGNFLGEPQLVATAIEMGARSGA
jgi:diguanylate cyclase (GGDEF)-like protein